jgi:hypothetical protein
MKRVTFMARFRGGYIRQINSVENAPLSHLYYNNLQMKLIKL